MDKEKSRRIGVFVYDWSMYTFIKDFVIKLAEAEFAVDIFHKDPDISSDFTKIEEFTHHDNVRYFKFNTSNGLWPTLVRRWQRCVGRVKSDYREKVKHIIDRAILVRSRKITAESKYQCFIGIEKKGLIWAGVLSRIYNCPLIYYSLELYIEDHSAAKNYFYLRKAEKHYHQSSGATIIQDSLRARTLLKYNEIGRTNLLYLPISVRGNVVERKSTFFHQKYKIGEATKFLLSFGQIQEERFSADLVRIASRLNDNMMLVLHGFGDQKYLAYLKSIADMDRVVLSWDLVAEDKIIDVIASATVGLALYDKTNSNDRLAAFSSVKVAYYMQCGVPVIAFNSESFAELMNAHKCGEIIDSIEEIPEKVQKILNDYDRYREQAFLAFKQFYNFDRNFQQFILDYDDYINSERRVQIKH